MLTSIERLQALQTDCTLSVQRSGVYEGLDGAVMEFKRGETDVYQQLNRISLRVTEADFYGVAIEILKRGRGVKIITEDRPEKKQACKFLLRSHFKNVASCLRGLYTESCMYYREAGEKPEDELE